MLAFDHPYVFGPTDTSGRFTLSQVPPGTYDLVVWHGPFTQVPKVVAGQRTRYEYGPPAEVVKRVEVTAQGNVELDITLTPP